MMDLVCSAQNPGVGALDRRMFIDPKLLEAKESSEPRSHMEQNK
jgi:hypothetical protein